MESIIIGTYPRSGARYLNALLCSRFNKMRGFDADQISLQDIDRYPTTGMILKTHDNEYEGTLKYKTIYCIRNPKDVMATFHKEDKIGASELANHTIISWVSHMYDWMNIAEENEILFLNYEDMINNEDDVIKKLAEFLQMRPNPNNHTRDSEIKAGKRPIGIYEEVFSQEHIEIIDETVEDCLEDLKEHL